MIAIVIERAGEPTRRKIFARDRDISIGRVEGNDLVLADSSVWDHHALIAIERKAITLEAIGDAPVQLAGKRVKRPKPFRGIASIGVFELRIVQPIPLQVVGAPDPVERELLDAIADRDEASRLVYADWLEHRGDVARAEFLRIQHELASLDGDDPMFERKTDRLRELAAHVDVTWRARVARPLIENCEGFDFQCPKEWGSLDATERTDIRYCGACKQNVYYSATVAQAREHAARGECVALDITSARWPADLSPPFEHYRCPSCQLDVGPGAFRCPSCAAEIRRPMVRGRMVITPRDFELD